MRAHAAEYNGRSKRIISASFSLGGAMAAIMTLDGDSFGDGCLVSGDLSAMAAGMVGLDGVYDTGELEVEMAPLTTLSFVQVNAADETLVFQLFTGATEQLHQQGERFQAALAAAGYEVMLTRQPELNHPAFKSSYTLGVVDTITALAYQQYPLGH